MTGWRTVALGHFSLAGAHPGHALRCLGFSAVDHRPVYTVLGRQPHDRLLAEVRLQAHLGLQRRRIPLPLPRHRPPSHHGEPSLTPCPNVGHHLSAFGRYRPSELPTRRSFVALDPACEARSLLDRSAAGLARGRRLLRMISVSSETADHATINPQHAAGDVPRPGRDKETGRIGKLLGAAITPRGNSRA